MNNYSVEYMVVGGVAVHYYDPTRKFDDLDLQINPTEVNAQRTIDALKSLGVGVEFDAQQLSGQKTRINVRHTYYVDIVTPAANFRFDDALAAAHDVMVNGVPVRLENRMGRPPKYLFPGLLKCASCGGYYSVRNGSHYVCSSQSNGRESLCGQKQLIRKDTIETELLADIKRQLLAPGFMKEISKEIRCRTRARCQKGLYASNPAQKQNL